MDLDKFQELAKKTKKSIDQVKDAWKKAKEEVEIPKDNPKYWGYVMKSMKNKLGIQENNYDEFYFISLAEEKNFGKNVFTWITKQKLSNEDIIDLDEKMAKKFNIPEEKAGKIIEIFVRHKAGGMDKNKAIKQIDKLK